MKNDAQIDDWKCHGWEDHDRAQLLDGSATSFRDRLLWLQNADRWIAWLETKRRWIDKDGVIHERAPAAAEAPAGYVAGATKERQIGDE